ncbi:Peptidase M48 family protein [Sphingomonas sp. EC-HK361]|uniref:M48 family metallopeptidase n=1 Tax=Sphingomonas sp. EC-HK361 TaxID=2038397 RepID=UPI0012517BF9|nr:M48 family metallopeptidase [Sphingomonas sp. EC-HK361]VVT08545.1 Peptidase M48 family protein [Sphingomonas sp. EC-HK361]
MPRILLAAALFVAASPSPAQTLSTVQLQELRRVDARLAAIAYRLTRANAPLCTDLQRQTGIVLHALDQYAPDTRANARSVFGFAAPVAVEAVVRGSVAEQAGVRADDGVVAIGGTRLAASAGDAATSADRDAAVALLAQPANDTVALDVVRDGARKALRIAASPGCASSFEVLLGPGMTAQSDGKIVQIAVGYFERYTDDEVAVIVAHELAHSILHHRERLDAAGVNGGLLAELGRNGRLNRLIEDQADQLGVHLLRNAGYDPQSAPKFWRAHGGEIDGGLFRSRTHRSSSARADRIEAEIKAIPANAPIPYTPPMLATRDAKLQ